MRSLQRQQIHAWMVRLADGDRCAFDPLFESLRPLLKRFAERLVERPEDAEDVTQQALLAIFRHSSRFDQSRDALSWAFGIAAWEAKTLRRKRLRRREEVLSPGVTSRLENRETPDLVFEERRLTQAATEVLDSLSAVDLETLLAATREGPRPEISAATFRKRLSRARQRLRLAWKMKHEP